MKLKTSLVALATVMTLAGCNKPAVPVITVDTMGIEVTSDENREYSYTDKESAYYYGRTHQAHFAEWYAGWNIKQRRIMSDYNLYVDTTLLNRADAQVTVYPHYLNRAFEQATEQFAMIDNCRILSIKGLEF